jgi:hydroxyacyl-ACP dehydratase HTD2-like protein with hotdog domain
MSTIFATVGNRLYASAPGSRGGFARAVRRGVIEVMNLNDWIGRSEQARDLVTAAPCAAFAATLDQPAERPAPGTPLPPLWHWLYFLPTPRRSELGPDGHAARGGFLPQARVRAYRFRAVRPTFDLHPFQVHGAPQPDGKTVRLWASDHEGWLTMDAVADVAP